MQDWVSAGAPFGCQVWRNDSLAMGMCSQGEWKKFDKNSGFPMNPFAQKIMMDVRVAGSIPQPLELSIKEGFFLYRVIFLVMGIVMLSVASTLSKSLAFYYTISMTIAFYGTPERRKISKEAWEKFTRDSAKKAVKELTSSPEFSKWVGANADRIATIAPKATNSANDSFGLSSSWNTILTEPTIGCKIPACGGG